MTIYLRQSTASQEIPIGQMLDSTDGDTEESGLTIANTDIKIWKAGATTLASKNSGGATYISNGVYYAVLDATDTNTAGSLVIFVHVSGALAERIECMVLPALVYDSMIAGTDNLQVDLIQWIGTAPLALTSQRVQSQVGAMAANVVTASAINSGAITSAKFAAGAIGTGVIAGTQTFAMTGNITGNLSGSVGSVTGAVGSVTGAVGSVTGNVGGNVTGSVGSVVGHTPQTGDNYARLGAPAGASVSADIAAVKSDSAAILVDTGTTLDAALAVVDSNVDAILADTADMQPKLGTPAADIAADIAAVKADSAAILTDTGTTIPGQLDNMSGATFNTATDSLEAIRDRGDAAWTTGAGGSAPTVAEIRAEIDSNSTQLAAIVADTNELQTDLANGGRLDLILDELTAQGDTNEAAIAVVDANVDAILADTADMQPKIGTPAGASVSADIAAVKADTAATLTDTGTTIPAQISGLNDLSAAQVNAEVDTAISDASLATAAAVAALNDLAASDLGNYQLPDSYSADGVQPTVAQALLEIRQFLLERATAGTTVTVKKPDGSTTAMTLTLNDATTPTSITRAT